MDYLKELEAEAIFILREAEAQFASCALLFSSGKDSIVLSHLAKKAFYPFASPFPLLHIDTGQNFKEVIEFRDSYCLKENAELIVRKVQESIDKGRVERSWSRNQMQSVTLLEAITTLKLDAVLGGARRDEDKARAKEKIFSLRGLEGFWEPQNQRPEFWNIYSGLKKSGEHFRIFPLSNWNELDVWKYIEQEELQLPSIYFSHSREVFRRNGTLIPNSPYINRTDSEKIEVLSIRFRTLGDMTSSGAILSNASNAREVIKELNSMPISERGGRMDDQFSETAMEDRKVRGYF